MKKVAPRLRSAVISTANNNSVIPKNLTVALSKSPNISDAIQAFDSIASTLTSNSDIDKLQLHNSLLQSYSSSEKSTLFDSFSLLRHMVKASPDFKPDRSTYHILITKSCVAPNPTLPAVYDALNFMSNAGFAPDKASADIAVRSLVSAGKIESALQLFDEMSSKNLLPDNNTYNFVVKSMCKCMSPGTVYAFLDKTRTKFGIKPDLVTYTILIDNVCNTKNLREMTRLVKVLKDEGFKLDCFVYNTIMKGYCALSQGRESIGVYNEMKENGVRPDIFTYNTLIFGLSKSGLAKEALKYLKVMEAEDGLHPDVVTYTAVINGLFRKRDPNGAFALFEEMKSKGCKPNSCTYNTLLHGFFKAEMLAQGMTLFQSVKEAKTELELVTYELMVRILCRSGQIAEAYEVFDYAVQSKSLTEVVAYVALENSLTSLHRSRKLGRPESD